MRAITVAKFGGPEVLQVSDVERPVPGPGEVLVRVLAAGVGPWDAHLRSGGWTGPLPYIPGGEFAGVVEGDSGQDADFDNGTPVYGYPGLTGCYAQYVVCPVEQMAPLPAGLPMTDAAGVPVDGMTAIQGLTDVLGISRGDQVLVTAAAGGLGTSPCRSPGCSGPAWWLRPARSITSSCTTSGRPWSSTTPSPPGPTRSGT